MSAGPEPSVDLVAVACVVESSLLLAAEWSRILIDYVYPLLKRLSELHPSHHLRLAFVTYGAADTRPEPLLSKRFFAPLSQVTKELRQEPSRLGIGQTGSGRGLSALEGLVAAIELFDILMTSSNYAATLQTQSPQKESRSLISHLLHVAASPPDAAQRPHCNTLSHLDSVSWESIPVELKKRKINLSLISLRKIPQFQNLQSLVAGPGAQSPWFNVRAPHILLLAGFPTPQKTGAKRQTDALLSDQSPDTKRQKVVPDTTPKAASPALSSARTPQNQRSQQPVSSQVPQPSPVAVSSQNSSSAQSAPASTSVSTSTPATVSPAPLLPPSAPSLPLVNSQPPSVPSLPLMNPQLLDQVVAPTGYTFGQFMERLKGCDRDILAIDSQIPNAQSAAEAANLQKNRAQKIQLKEQIKQLLRHFYQRMLQSKDALNTQVRAPILAPSNGSARIGPSTQSHPTSAPGASSEWPTGPSAEERKPAIPDSQILAQFWQSRGGSLSGTKSTLQAGPSQTQPHPALTPEVAAQVQKLIEKKGNRPPTFGPSLQMSGTPSSETGGSTNATQPSSASTWQGTFSAAFPKHGGQVTNDIQIHVFGNIARNDIRTDTWPQNLALKACKEPLKEKQELLSWLERHQSRIHAMQFRPNPRAPDGSINEQKFQALVKLMTETGVYAYTGWQMPSGKFSYNILVFPMGNTIFGALFPDGLPDLPGSGNTLDSQLSGEEAKPQPFGGLNIPPAFIARLQNFDPEKRKQFIAHVLRVKQEQTRQQQLQKTQQPSTVPSQTSNPLGLPIPPNSYRPVANIPPGLRANANVPTSAGAFNAGGGTVNYEMLQSFMQRSAEPEGSTSQSMNLG